MIMKTDGSFAALAWNLILPQPPAPRLVLVVAEKTGSSEDWFQN